MIHFIYRNLQFIYLLCIMPSMNFLNVFLYTSLFSMPRRMSKSCFISHVSMTRGQITFIPVCPSDRFYYSFNTYKSYFNSRTGRSKIQKVPGDPLQNLSAISTRTTLAVTLPVMLFQLVRQFHSLFSLG